MTRQQARVLLVAAGLFALPILPGARADTSPDQRKGPGGISQRSGVADRPWGRNPGEKGGGGREVSQ